MDPEASELGVDSKVEVTHFRSTLPARIGPAMVDSCSCVFIDGCIMLHSIHGRLGVSKDPCQYVVDVAGYWIISKSRGG